jgi:hypothetical protein
MSRFSKEMVSPEEITEAFITDIADIANRTFGDWFDGFIIAANEHGGITTNTMEGILGQANPNTVYLAVLLALHSLPMEKILDSKSAEKIYDQMRISLKKYTTKKENEIAPMVFDLVNKLKRSKDTLSETTLLSAMRLLELDKHESTRGLFTNEEFLKSAQTPNFEDSLDWWDFATDKVQVAV